MIKSTAVLAVALAAAVASPLGAGSRASGRAFVTNTFSLTAADWTRLHGGRVVARTLEASHKREVATLGVVRVNITPDYYISQLEDIATFKKSDQVLQVGRFSTPPSLSDVAAMTLDDADIRLLRSCRLNDCGVRLPAQAIARFGHEIDWRRSDARERATALFRQVLVEYVAAYTKSGAAVSMRYADTGDHLDTAREAREVAAIDSGGWRHFPQLGQHVLEYSGQPATGITDVIYWSKEKVASRNVVSITHLSIARTTDSPADYAVASKQIYGAHYFDASLGLTILVRDEASPSAATYVVYLNRTRVDLFDGLFGGVTRSIVSGKARGTVSDHLTLVQQRLERLYRASPTVK